MVVIVILTPYNLYTTSDIFWLYAIPPAVKHSHLTPLCGAHPRLRPTLISIGRDKVAYLYVLIGGAAFAVCSRNESAMPGSAKIETWFLSIYSTPSTTNVLLLAFMLTINGLFRVIAMAPCS